MLFNLVVSSMTQVELMMEEADVPEMIKEVADKLKVIHVLKVTKEVIQLILKLFHVPQMTQEVDHVP